MTQRYAPGLFDRLLPDPASGAHAWTLRQLKAAVARDLENLLNTRAALAEQLLARFPHVCGSLLSYGLADFAGLCLSSEEDQRAICAAVQLAVRRHEPRLRDVSATLRGRPESINRLDFVISGKLRGAPAGERVHFDAMLKPSTQQYAISMAGL